LRACVIFPIKSAARFDILGMGARSLQRQRCGVV
jgi:hypothetical protein